MRYIIFELHTPWFTIPIMGYGLMIVLGFMCGIALAVWRAKRCGENPEHIMNLGLLALIGGIGGARLLYVIDDWDNFSRMADGSPRGLWGLLVAALNVRAGGLVYFGGLILATLLALIYIYRKKLSTRRILDILAPSLMLGLAFGRGGCTLNGCCWGGRCDLPSPTAQKLLTITFPFASPVFDDQARDLPWLVANKDGQVLALVMAPEPDREGRSLRVHMISEPGAEAARRLARKPHMTIPPEFLRPRLGPDYETSPWTAVDDKGRPVAYYERRPAVSQLGEPVRDLDGEAVYQHVWSAGPLANSVEVPAANVVVDDDGARLRYSYLSRDEVTRLIDSGAGNDKQLAAHYGDLVESFRSLPVYPAQLYGIANGLFLCLVLSVFFPRRTREGQVFALMLVLVAVSRFILEAVRKDTDAAAFGLTLSQNISLWIFAAGVAMWLVLYKLPPVARVPLSGATAPAGEAAS